MDDAPRIGDCNSCGETTSTVPHDHGLICRPCAEAVHEAGRTTAWWPGPAFAQPPAKAAQ